MLKTTTVKNIERALKTALLGCALLLAACGQAEITPVEINPEDMCSMCRMAISEKQYASEFITKDGDAMKFDDLTCLREYLKTKGGHDQIAAYFVADYETKKWLKGESAHFVKSAEFATPMGGNIVAFGSDEKAKEAMDKYKGERIKFADVIGK
ncbi:MAG: hypothetical protein JMDDDDMK_01856 [Acidobacteria bacterium]|nr:hypothetical protein [Acidobacteriota bacterium]